MFQIFNFYKGRDPYEFHTTLAKCGEDLEKGHTSEDEAMGYIGKNITELTEADIPVIDKIRKKILGAQIPNVLADEIDFYSNVLHSKAQVKQQYWEHRLLELIKSPNTPIETVLRAVDNFFNEAKNKEIIRIEPKRFREFMVEEFDGTDYQLRASILSRALSGLEEFDALNLLKNTSDERLIVGLANFFPIIKDTEVKQAVAKRIIKILKKSVEKSGAEGISHLGIKDQKTLIEIVTLCAQHSGRTLLYLKDFGITNQKTIIDFAKICAKEDSGTAACLQYIGVTDPKTLFEIVKISAQYCPPDDFSSLIGKNIDPKDFMNEKERYEIAEIHARRDPKGFSHLIDCYDLSLESRIELAKLSAQGNGKATAKNIANFGISDPKTLSEIATLCAENSGETILYLKNFGITDQKTIIDFAKICAKQYGKTADYLKGLGITDHKTLFEIVKISAQNCQGEEFTHAMNTSFNFDKEEERYEIAEIHARRIPNGLVFYVGNYNLGRELRKKLARICVQDDAAFIQVRRNFKLSGKDQLELGALACLQDIKAFYLYQPEWKSDSHLKEYVEACKKLGWDFSPILDTINGIKSAYAKEQNLDWFACSLYFIIGSLEEAQMKWIPDQGILQAIQQFQRPDVRFALTLAAIDLAIDANSDRRIDFEKSTATTKEPWEKIVHLLGSSLLVPKDEGAGNVVDRLRKTVTTGGKKSYFQDFEKHNPLIVALIHLYRDEFLKPEEKIHLLKRALDNMDAKLGTPRAKNDKFLNDLLVIESVLEIGEGEMLKNDAITFEKCHEMAFRKKVPLGEVPDFNNKWLKFVKEHRNPKALMTYVGKIASLHEPAAEHCFGKYITGALNDTFPADRYRLEGNTHLTMLEKERPGILERWKQGMTVKLDQLTTKQMVPFEKPQWFDWLKTKLIDDKHLDLGQLGYLKKFLDAPPKEQEKIKEELTSKIKSGSKEKSETAPLVLQQMCIRLANLKDPSQELSELKGLEKILLNTTYATSEFLKTDVQGNIRLLEARKQEVQTEKVIVTITDDKVDLSQCGNEVAGSCMRTDGNPQLNKGLLGYLMDGKNLLVCVKSEEGPKGTILARCMIRLLWDGKNPVIFRERLYPNPIDDKYAQALNEMVRRKAEAMGCAVGSLDGKGAPCDPLQALGGPAPWEYSDGVGGITPNGKYTISNAKLLD